MNNNYKRAAGFRRGANDDELRADFDAWDKNIDSLFSNDADEIISSTPRPNFADGTSSFNHDYLDTSSDISDVIESELDAGIAQITAVPGTVEDEISQALDIGMAEMMAIPEPVEDEISHALSLGIAEITQPIKSLDSEIENELEAEFAQIIAD